MAQGVSWRAYVPFCSLQSFQLQAPSWLRCCWGGDSKPWQAFTFEGYQADDFDQLLSGEQTSPSFLSRLPFKRRTIRRPKISTHDSCDSSSRSLFIDDRDAELFGDESINLLLTSQTEPSTGLQLPIGHQTFEGQDDDELRREEEQLRIEEEQRIKTNRERARKLAAYRGLLRSVSSTSLLQCSSAASSIGRTRSSRSGSLKSEMNMIQRSANKARQAEQEYEASEILPHKRPA